MRRNEWIEKVNLEDSKFNGKSITLLKIYFLVFDNAANDSLAYKTQFFDFRNEKGRDKTLDISPLSFTISNFKTASQRAVEAEEKILKLVFKEKYTKKEEM